MTRLIPERLICDHLFLLVGENTLPNWVAARLLTRPKGHIYLVATKGVVKQAERLAALLKQDSRNVASIETHDSDERKIYEDIRAWAIRIQERVTGRFGLNYTGGTKMMSVHAHHALRDILMESGQSQPIFSYLNAGDLKMKFDRSSLQDPIDVSCHPDVCLDIRRLFDLHDESDKFSYDSDVKAIESAKGLAILHSNPAGHKAWMKWYSKFKEKKFDPHHPLPMEEEFQQSVEIELDQSLTTLSKSKVVSQMMGGYGEVLDGLGVKAGFEVQAACLEFADVRALANWFNGLWLEHYTLGQLQLCDGVRWNIGGLSINLRATSEEERDFQADVLALRGYQLFYFSCFTGNEIRTTKLKLFEAMVRAEQVGGEEARAAVVSCVDNYETVRRQAEADWERVRTLGQFEVFGRAHLPKLAEHFSEWINRR